jgi:hypothetical protein
MIYQRCQPSVIYVHLQYCPLCKSVRHSNPCLYIHKKHSRVTLQSYAAVWKNSPAQSRFVCGQLQFLPSTSHSAQSFIYGARVCWRTSSWVYAVFCFPLYKPMSEKDPCSKSWSNKLEHAFIKHRCGLELRSTRLILDRIDSANKTLQSNWKL